MADTLVGEKQAEIEKTNISVVYEDDNTLIYTLVGSGVFQVKRKGSRVTMRIEPGVNSFEVTASEGFLKPFKKHEGKQMFYASTTPS